MQWSPLIFIGLHGVMCQKVCTTLAFTFLALRRVQPQIYSPHADEVCVLQCRGRAKILHGCEERSGCVKFHFKNKNLSFH
jgi:hypothetical protein